MCNTELCSLSSWPIKSLPLNTAGSIICVAPGLNGTGHGIWSEVRDFRSLPTKYNKQKYFTLFLTIAADVICERSLCRRLVLCPVQQLDDKYYLIRNGLYAVE